MSTARFLLSISSGMSSVTLVRPVTVLYLHRDCTSTETGQKGIENMEFVKFEFILFTKPAHARATDIQYLWLVVARLCTNK